MKNIKNKKNEKSTNKKDSAIKNQAKLDHDQHYDIDGVTRKDGEVKIAENNNLKKMN